MKTIFITLLLTVAGFSSALGQHKAYILSPDQGVEEERGFKAELKATPNTTGEYMFTITEKPFWFRTPVHQRNSDMSFYVLEGEFQLFINNEVHRLVPGSFAFVPANTPVAYCSCAPDRNTKWVHVFDQGKNVIEFWEAMFARGEKREATGDPGKPIAELAAEFDVEYIAEPPFTKPEN